MSKHWLGVVGQIKHFLVLLVFDFFNFIHGARPERGALFVQLVLFLVKLSLIANSKVWVLSFSDRMDFKHRPNVGLVLRLSRIIRCEAGGAVHHLVVVPHKHRKPDLVVPEHVFVPRPL